MLPSLMMFVDFIDGAKEFQTTCIFLMKSTVYDLGMYDDLFVSNVHVPSLFSPLNRSTITLINCLYYICVQQPCNGCFHLIQNCYKKHMASLVMSDGTNQVTL